MVIMIIWSLTGVVVRLHLLMTAKCFEFLPQELLSVSNKTTGIHSREAVGLELLEKTGGKA